MDIKKRRSDRYTRRHLRSPGRPPVANRHERAMFWSYVAAGMSSEAASVKAGVSQPAGTRGVSGGRRSATSDIQALSEALVGQIFVAGGARRDRVVVR